MVANSAFPVSPLAEFAATSASWEKLGKQRGKLSAAAQGFFEQPSSVSEAGATEAGRESSPLPP